MRLLRTIAAFVLVTVAAREVLACEAGNSSDVPASVESRNFICPIVAAPLREADFEFIEQYIIGKKSLVYPNVEHVYSLILDESPRAKEDLRKIRRLYSHHTWLPKVDTAPSITGALTEKKVLDSAFYLRSDERAHAKLLFIRHVRDKETAVAKLHVFRGPMAQQWFQIVFTKVPKGWRHSAVTICAVTGTPEVYGAPLARRP